MSEPPNEVFITFARMLFNSIEFGVFLPIVFVLYWFVTQGHLKWQNALIGLASYFFYGWWDWRFLLLIFASTLVDFQVAKAMERSPGAERKKWLLWISLSANLGLLIYFKYWNFFVDSFLGAFTFFGREFDPWMLNVILPVGISFYTFQTLSYTIDVYRGRIRASHDFTAFAAYVSFFPQLVAGPIERAGRLLPQFYRPRTFDYAQAVLGGKQIIWGLFKKMVIADNCAVVVNHVFDQPEAFPASTLVLGAVMFAFQIYGDFSGYSDIAIGTARLFGIELMRNFAYPYFSRNVAEFWRRWHISLSTWFRDYLYIPLGGSRGPRWLVIRNTFIIFLVSGFWHGANWTFIVWGGLHALFFLPLLLRSKNRRYLEVVAVEGGFPSLREGIGMVRTFLLVTLAWIFFRAESVGAAWGYLQGMADPSLLEIPSFPGRLEALITMGFILLMLVIEYAGRTREVPLTRWDERWSRWGRFGFYYLAACIIALFAGREQAFIYFQF